MNLLEVLVSWVQQEAVSKQLTDYTYRLTGFTRLMFDPPLSAAFQKQIRLSDRQIEPPIYFSSNASSICSQELPKSRSRETVPLKYTSATPRCCLHLCVRLQRRHLKLVQIYLLVAFALRPVVNPNPPVSRLN